MRTTVLTLFASALVLGGCSYVEPKKIDYKSAGSLPTLEVPPDLILPSGDNRYAVPDIGAPRGAATYSAYSAERSGQKLSNNSDLLPAIEKVSMSRSGSQRWLVVQMQAGDVWPVVKDFWQELGFLINLELPDAGVMETDWAENRAKIPQDPIRNFLGKVIDQVYSTAERDKFRTRIERSPDGKSTEIYISHRGMYEVFEGTSNSADQGTGRTVWQPRPADPELEAEMLSRLMVRFGVEETRARALLAEKSAQPRASKITGPDGIGMLAIPESFDRAWRRVGLALDRINFAVEDRDRAAGVYYVRYADPDAGGKEKGFLSKLAFWSSDEAKALSQRYRVRVTQEGELTQVAVQEDSGKPLKTETGQRIINLLFEQLK